MIEIEVIETVADLEDHLVDEVLAAERAYVADDTDGGDSPPVRTDGGTLRRQAPPLNWDTVTRFQVDLLLAAASAGPCKGLRLKRELERYYDDGVNHGRLYPNLNDLAEQDVLEKRPREPDERSNQYAITQAGRDLLEGREQTIARALSFTGPEQLPAAPADPETGTNTETATETDTGSDRDTDPEEPGEVGADD